jgi:hypothetical protein
MALIITVVAVLWGTIVIPILLGVYGPKELDQNEWQVDKYHYHCGALVIIIDIFQIILALNLLLEYLSGTNLSPSTRANYSHDRLRILAIILMVLIFLLFIVYLLFWLSGAPVDFSFPSLFAPTPLFWTTFGWILFFLHRVYADCSGGQTKIDEEGRYYETRMLEGIV